MTAACGFPRSSEQTTRRSPGQRAPACERTNAACRPLSPDSPTGRSTTITRSSRPSPSTSPPPHQAVPKSRASTWSPASRRRPRRRRPGRRSPGPGHRPRGHQARLGRRRGCRARSPPNRGHRRGRRRRAGRCPLVVRALPSRRGRRRRGPRARPGGRRCVRSMLEGGHVGGAGRNVDIPPRRVPGSTRPWSEHAPGPWDACSEDGRCCTARFEAGTPIRRDLFQVVIAWDSGIPSAAMRLRPATPIIASVFCPAGVRDRRWSPTTFLNWYMPFSARACWCAPDSSLSSLGRSGPCRQLDPCTNAMHQRQATASTATSTGPRLGSERWSRRP